MDSRTESNINSASKSNMTIIEHETKFTKICFICTGNICRSPMAAAVYNKYGKKYNTAAVSAGLFPEPGAPITYNAAKVLNNAMIETPAHEARRISEKIINECSKIIGMTEHHAFILAQMFPSAVHKIGCMPEDISDPYGGSLEEYKECLDQIISGLKKMFDFIE